MNPVTYLQGKKTYITLGVGIVLLLLVNVAHIPIDGIAEDPQWGVHLVELLAGIFLRSGVTASGPR